MLCLIETAIGYVILMILSSTLIGLFIRNLVPALMESDAPKNEQEMRKVLAKYTSTHSDRAIFGAVLCLIYLVGLFQLFNIVMVAAAIMLMLARLPDLLWEIRTGQKVTRRNAPRGLLGLLSILLSWGAIPVLWFALCRVK